MALQSEGAACTHVHMVTIRRQGIRTARYPIFCNTHVRSMYSCIIIVVRFWPRNQPFIVVVPSTHYIKLVHMYACDYIVKDLRL